MLFPAPANSPQTILRRIFNTPDDLFSKIEHAGSKELVTLSQNRVKICQMADRSSLIFRISCLNKIILPYLYILKKRLYRFLLFMLLVQASQVFGQTHELDSLYAVLKEHPQRDTNRVRTLLRACYREYTSHPEKNKALAEEAMSISRDINYLRGQGFSFRYIALYYWQLGDYDQATKYAYEMLRTFEGIPMRAGIGQAYQLLGTLHSDEGDFAKAETFYKKALEIYQALNFKRDLGYCFNSLGTLYYNFSKFDDALTYFLRSLAVRNEINDLDGLAQAYGNLAHVYMSQKKFDQALENFEKAITIDQKSHNNYRLAANFAGLGEMYLAKNEYQPAELYSLKAIDLAKSLHQKKILHETYSQLKLIEKKRGRFEKALTYFDLESAYRDSIYTEEKTEKIAEVEARYETGKKDQAIQLLVRDKKIQRLWTNIFIAAFVLVTALSVVVYLLQRDRERKNRQILDLELDNLTAQHKELSERYKNILTTGNENFVESQDQRLLKKAVASVENNLSDPLFSVEKMARELGMSRTNMHRKIKAITGFPPSELIRSIRLRKAAILLLNQADSIAQISFMVGFEDHSYFSKSFKKHFGVSPTEYVQARAPEVLKMAQGS